MNQSSQPVAATTSPAHTRPRRKWLVPTLFGIAGLLIGMAGLVVGILVAGGGHGWNTGAMFSFLGLVLSPWAFFQLGQGRSARTRTSGGLLLAAVVLDVLLVVMTFQEGISYLRRVGDGWKIWTAFWLPWQLAAAISFAIVRIKPAGSAKR